MRFRNWSILSMLCLGLGLTQNSRAAGPDTWQYEVTPYFLGAGLNGKAGVLGRYDAGLERWQVLFEGGVKMVII